MPFLLSETPSKLGVSSSSFLLPSEVDCAEFGNSSGVVVVVPSVVLTLHYL